MPVRKKTSKSDPKKSDLKKSDPGKVLRSDPNKNESNTRSLTIKTWDTLVKDKEANKIIKNSWNQKNPGKLYENVIRRLSKKISKSVKRS
jgi:hypothetical protein